MAANRSTNPRGPGAIQTNIQERTEKRRTEKAEIRMERPEPKPSIDEGQGEPGYVGRRSRVPRRAPEPPRVRRRGLRGRRRVAPVVTAGTTPEVMNRVPLRPREVRRC